MKFRQKETNKLLTVEQRISPVDVRKDGNDFEESTRGRIIVTPTGPVTVSPTRFYTNEEAEKRLKQLLGISTKVNEAIASVLEEVVEKNEDVNKRNQISSSLVGSLAEKEKEKIEKPVTQSTYQTQSNKEVRTSEKGKELIYLIGKANDLPMIDQVVPKRRKLDVNDLESREKPLNNDNSSSHEMDEEKKRLQRTDSEIPVVEMNRMNEGVHLSVPHYEKEEDLEFVEDETSLKALSTLDLAKSDLKKMKTQASYLESFIFTKADTIVLLDPERGTIYRALELKKNTIILLSSEMVYRDKLLRDEFQPKYDYDGVDLKFEVDEQRLSDYLVYHGRWGFKPSYLRKAYALELNPYASDISEVFYHFHLERDHMSISDVGGKEEVFSSFRHFPNHFRIDAWTLHYNRACRGDMFVVSMKEIPTWEIPVQPKMKGTILSDLMCYENLPEYRQWQHMMVSYDEKFVYDVKNSFTCFSRRHQAIEIALSMGKQIKPLSQWGNWVAHANSTTFDYVDYSLYNGVFIFKSNMIAGNAIIDDNTAKGKKESKYTAVLFVHGDFRGKVIEPLEEYGSFFSQKLLVDGTTNWHYVDLRAINGVKGLIFKSTHEMLHHSHLVRYYCRSSMDFKDMMVRPVGKREKAFMQSKMRFQPKRQGDKPRKMSVGET